MVIFKFLLVNPATSATGDRAFAMERRVKIWILANMNQQTFHHVALLQTKNSRQAAKICRMNLPNETKSVDATSVNLPIEICKKVADI